MRSVTAAGWKDVVDVKLALGSRAGADTVKTPHRGGAAAAYFDAFAAAAAAGLSGNRSRPTSVQTCITETANDEARKPPANPPVEA